MMMAPESGISSVSPHSGDCDRSIPETGELLSLAAANKTFPRSNLCFYWTPLNVAAGNYICSQAASWYFEARVQACCCLLDCHSVMVFVFLHDSVSMLVGEACEQMCLSCWLMARDTERGQGSFPRNGDHCSLSVPNVLLPQFIVQPKSHTLSVIPNKLK